MKGMLAGPIHLASTWFGEPGGIGMVFGALVVLLILLAAALFISVRLVSRRRWSEDIREVVVTLEELRSGKMRRKAEVEAHSPLTLIADAVNRLGQDLQVRLGESVSAGERLKLVMEALKDSAIITTDMDGDIRSFSSGAETMLGWSENEVVAQPSALIFDDEAYKEFLPKLARRSLRERGISARSMLKRRDGTTFPANLTVRALHGTKQESVGLLMVVQDVSQQARLEDELRSSEERYRRLIEGLGDGVAIVREGRLLYVNPAFSGMCALPEPRLVGTPLRDRIATRDVLMVEERLTRLEQRPGETDELACTIVGRDEHTRVDVRVHAAAVEYESGKAVLLLVHDETATRRIEQELRRNESQLDAVLEATSDGILVLIDGTEGALTQMTNRAFLRMFALREQDVLGLPEGKLIALLRVRGAGEATVAGLLASGSPAPRGEALRLGGPARTAAEAPTTPKEVRVFLLPLAERGGRPIGRVLVCRDLTRQRESERKLQHHAEQLQLSKVMLERAYKELDGANRKLQARTEELDQLNQELRTLDEMRRKLLGNVSHELQAPLVAIRGYTEMTLKERLGPISEEQRKGLSLSLRNIDRLIALIDSITGTPEAADLQLSRFSLRTLIEEATEVVRDKMQGKGIHFMLDMPADGVEVHADREKILRVFINLFSNAIKFNKQGGSVEVRVRPGESGYLTAEIEDTGVGIAAGEIGRIFERRFRAGGAAEEAKGHGLGLAIVREILRQHGCSIEARSEIDSWTRMTLTLPMVSEWPGTDGEDRDRTEDREQKQEEEPEKKPEKKPEKNQTKKKERESEEEEEARGQDRAQGEGDEEPPSLPRRPRFRIIRRYDRR
jgi:PAS domain S-box-containing protein